MAELNGKPGARPDFGAWEQWSSDHCSEPEVFRAVFDKPQTLRPLVLKARKRVYFHPDGLVFKHFLPRKVRAGKVPGWEKERRALARLEGKHAPGKGAGYLERTVGGETEALTCRPFVYGEEVRRVEPGQIDDLVQLYAAFHRVGVTSEDPTITNFVYDGTEFHFIDLEWAKVHDSPLTLYPKVGKELANLRLKVFEKDKTRFGLFRRRYLEVTRPGPFARLLIALGFQWWRLKKTWFTSGKGVVR